MRILIQTHDGELAKDLLGVSGEPAPHTEVAVPGGTTLEFQYRAVCFSEEAPDKLHFILRLASDAAWQEVASWLAKQLRGRVVSVYIDGHEVSITKDGIASGIARCLEELLGADDNEAEERQRGRIAFLRRLRDTAGGDCRRPIDSLEEGTRLGMSREEVAQAVRFWEGWGAVRAPYAAFGKPLLVHLTPRSVDQIVTGILEDRTASGKACFGDPEQANGLSTEIGEPGRMDTNVFRKEGEIWTICYDGERGNFKDTKGMKCLWILVSNQGVEFTAPQMLEAIEGAIPETVGARGTISRAQAAEEGLETVGPAHAGPIMDSLYSKKVRQQVSDLIEEKREAKELGDADRLVAIQNELEELEERLTRSHGLGGRVRRGDDHGVRLKKRVSENIRRALVRIKTGLPRLHRHLRYSLQKSPGFAYRPSEPVRWTC